METKKEINKISYLIRRLTIHEGGESHTLPLRYVSGVIDGKEIYGLAIEEYNGERPGCEYYNRMDIMITGSRVTILSLSSF